MLVYLLLIKPLELFFETVYSLIYKWTGNYGLSIVFLSLIVNILILPIYRRADMVQVIERKKEQQMEKWIQRIKRTFKGDERFFLLQTYYRQNNYKPIDMVKGLMPLFLEIPFFIAAYHFLSGLSVLNGESFWLISDLGRPDGLLKIGGISLNVLPILMTVINIFSGVIYTRNTGVREKIQIYAMAVIFCLLLYKSPSALAFYWLLNNLFSLFKNIICIFINNTRVAEDITVVKTDKKIFVMSGVLISFVSGIMIQSLVVTSSSEEFVNLSNPVSPVINLVLVFIISLGLYLVWPGLFYFLSGNKAKHRLAVIYCALSICGIINYLFFGRNLGLISPEFIYYDSVNYTVIQRILNILAMIAVFAVVQIVLKKKNELIQSILIILILTSFFITEGSIVNIMRDFKYVKELKNTMSGDPAITLSRTGKNVIVIMLDGAISYYVPYIMNEKPELINKFDGFRFYPNSVSFGTHTNFGSPCLYGGYEYTPDEMNKRDELTLQEKQDEALKVMPVLFAENGFEVTVCDPTYAGYQMIPDLTIYDDYPEIHRYITMGTVGENKEVNRDIKERNMLFYGLFRSVPLYVQPLLYDKGNYNSVSKYDGDIVRFTPMQRVEGLSKSKGVDHLFLKSYLVLKSLADFTCFSNDEKGTFTMMSNDTTHDLNLLQEPEYEPREIVDNTEYDNANRYRYASDGSSIELNNYKYMVSYQMNMAAFLNLGKWFDYMRENGVYDNTRIIIVSDHGGVGIGNPDNHIRYLENGENAVADLNGFLCMLMVKDFNSQGFTVEDTFMTNADTPTLAVKDIVSEPLNPFSGKRLDGKEYKSRGVKLIYSDKFGINTNNGTKFLDANWFSVKDAAFDIDNWKYIGYH